MSLWTDLLKIQESLQDSLSRLECLRECHLQERPDHPLPDFLFPLQRYLEQSLEEAQDLQKVLQKEHLKGLAAQARTAQAVAEARAGQVQKAESVQDLLDQLKED